MKYAPIFLTLLATSATAAERPNIVLVMADDQGWNQTSYNGHPVLKTPNLDAMAAAGIRFNRFYAAGPVCSPTRASVLTGRTHHRTGVPSHGHNLCLQEKTLPQAVKKAGYATGHFGKWHLNGIRGPGVPVLGDDAVLARARRAAALRVASLTRWVAQPAPGLERRTAGVGVAQRWPLSPFAISS